MLATTAAAFCSRLTSAVEIAAAAVPTAANHAAATNKDVCRMFHSGKPCFQKRADLRSLSALPPGGPSLEPADVCERLCRDVEGPRKSLDETAAAERQRVESEVAQAERQPGGAKAPGELRDACVVAGGVPVEHGDGRLYGQSWKLHGVGCRAVLLVHQDADPRSRRQRLRGAREPRRLHAARRGHL